MFGSQDADLPLHSKFYKDGSIWSTIEGGLTQGDAVKFIKNSDNYSKYPTLKDMDNNTVNGVETMSDWFDRYGRELEKDIREFVNK